MSYPCFKSDFLEEELAEYFSLDEDDRAFLEPFRVPTARLGCAVLLKSILYLGYVPEKKSDIPRPVVELLASETEVAPGRMRQYRWRDRTWKHHLARIREHTGLRPYAPLQDQTRFVDWIGARAAITPARKDLLVAAIEWFAAHHIELPAEDNLRRLIGSATRGFWEKLYETIAGQIEDTDRAATELFLLPADGEPSQLEWLKSPAGRPGVKTILEELDKLRVLRGLRLPSSVARLNTAVYKRLLARARPENAFELRRHPAAIRLTLFAVLVHARKVEILDGVIKLFLALIGLIDAKADKALAKELLQQIEVVYGKKRMLFEIAKASVRDPDGAVRKVIFSVVPEETMRRLIEESQATETRYQVRRAGVKCDKYARTYRRMVGPVLDALSFRTNNPAYEPVLRGVDLVNRHFRSRSAYLPRKEDVPAELLTGHWRDIVTEGAGSRGRVTKKLFELCVLEHLAKAIKSKEVWVEGSFKFRDPDQDLPRDWSERRVAYYQKHDIEMDPKKAVGTLRQRMIEALQHLNEYLGRMGKRDVYVYFPREGAKRAFWRVPKIRKRAERPIIGKIKEEVLKNWGTLDLLDLLLEADRRVGFSRFFQSSAQRQILSEEEVRYRVNLVIFGLATGMGLRRVHTAVDAPFKYDSVLYFLSRYVTVEVLRELNTALANTVLRLRKRKVWGRTTACASDGKLLGAWDQNLVADWLPHRMKEGVYAYWHVDTNSLCVFGQVTSGPPRSAELAAMIRGLVEHDTAMCIDSNAVDSHGQSEGTWPFCHLMGVKLRPRLKRLKYERVYLPSKGFAQEVPNLEGILARAIRWDRIEKQYDEIVKHVVAVKEGTGPVESILRRFSTSNRTSRVYKAGLEMGKALKTIFLCEVLSNPRLRVEIHDALNIVESWNSCIQFISYGRRTELPTNDPTMQELITLCIMLQQNALVMVNTLLVDQIIEEQGLLSRMTAADKRALTPLFTSNINPYGDFSLDLAKPSILDRRSPADHRNGPGE